MVKKATKMVVKLVNRRGILHEGEVYIPLSDVPTFVRYAKDVCRESVEQEEPGLLKRDSMRALEDAQEILVSIVASYADSIEDSFTRNSKGTAN